MSGAVCVVGSFMMDLVAQCDTRPADGETVIGTGFEMFLGGKGFNQALAASRSGASTSMVGRVGDDDFGRRFLSALEDERIDARGVHVDGTHGTGVGLPVVEASGRNSIVVVPRANHALAAADLEAAADVICDADVLLLQWELPIESALVAARIARAARTAVVLNPAPAVGDLGAFAGLVDVVVPNEAEAAALTGSDDPARAVELLRALLGCDGVVLTLGEAGAHVADGPNTVALAAHEVACIDTVGAGDAFCGAMAAALADGASLADAARRGNAAGALAVTVAGAAPSMPTAAAIDALL